MNSIIKSLLVGAAHHGWAHRSLGTNTEKTLENSFCELVSKMSQYMNMNNVISCNISLCCLCCVWLVSWTAPQLCAETFWWRIRGGTLLVLLHKLNVDKRVYLKRREQHLIAFSHMCAKQRVGSTDERSNFKCSDTNDKRSARRLLWPHVMSYLNAWKAGTHTNELCLNIVM